VALEQLSVYALGAYQGYLRATVIQLKKHQRAAWAGHLGALLAAELSRQAPPEIWRERVVTCVPSTPSRRRYRGFNPAARIGETTARALGLPFEEMLACVGDQPSIKAMTRRQRSEVAPTPFRLICPVPERVLLIDDVLTTGSTLLRARAALGSCDLVAAVVARSTRL
jgi:predicted amidophosphoribosyltransferase